MVDFLASLKGENVSNAKIAKGVQSAVEAELDHLRRVVAVLKNGSQRAEAIMAQFEQESNYLRESIRRRDEALATQRSQFLKEITSMKEALARKESGKETAGAGAARTREQGPGSEEAASLRRTVHKLESDIRKQREQIETLTHQVLDAKDTIEELTHTLRDVEAEKMAAEQQVRRLVPVPPTRVCKVTHQGGGSSRFLEPPNAFARITAFSRGCRQSRRIAYQVAELAEQLAAARSAGDRAAALVPDIPQHPTARRAGVEESNTPGAGAGTGVKSLSRELKAWQEHSERALAQARERFDRKLARKDRCRRPAPNPRTHLTRCVPRPVLTGHTVPRPIMTRHAVSLAH